MTALDDAMIAGRRDDQRHRVRRQLLRHRRRARRRRPARDERRARRRAAALASSDLDAASLVVEASSTAGIDATILSATSTGADGFGFTLAFNSIGWKAQNFLFNAVDTLLGDPLVASAFNGEQPAASDRRRSRDSTITAAGDVHGHAVNAAQLNATVSNAATSVARRMYGAKGKSVGGILASATRSRAPRTATIDELDRRPPAAPSPLPPSTTPASREREDGLVVDHDERRRHDASSRTRSTTSSPADFLLERGHAGR